MKKIISAFDAFKFSGSTQDYSVFLASELSAHLNAIFFEDSEHFIYTNNQQRADTGKVLKRQAKKETGTANRTLISSFEKACKEKNISYSVQRDNHMAISELLQESIYADFLLLAINETFYHRLERKPAQFIRHLFAEVQCPVLLVPEQFQPIEKIVFLYDGEPLSVNAVKMFSYVFGDFKNIQPEVITVKNDLDELSLTNNRLVKEFIKRHYPEAAYTVLKGNAKDAVVSFLKRQSPNTLVVVGAEQKTAVNSLFKEDMVDVLIREVKKPLYIVHDK